MPASSPLGKDLIQKWFKTQKDIKNIVDVGPGEGTYFKLLGNKYYWIGIEIWPKNIEKYKLKKKYNKIIGGDVSKLPTLPIADCIILGDVVEHLDKYTAFILLRKAIVQYQHVVISIPIGKYVQGPIDGNPHEEHKSYWTYEEIEDITSWKLTKTFTINPDIPNLKIGVFIK